MLYIGVTNDLIKRVYQHKEGLIPGFSKKYKTKKLVYFESCSSITDAIAREKQLKGWRRSKKLALIKSINPTMSDLSRSFDGVYPERSPIRRGGAEWAQDDRERRQARG